MSNIIVSLAVFLITVIGALFAVPYFIDWNGYRGVFEEEATRILGREVRVGGAVNLHLLPTPYFRFEKVRIADTSVNLQEPFFRADSLTVKLTVPPLFRGAIEAHEIEFQRPVLRLALNDKDGWNWQSFGQTLGSTAYLPSNVALTSVKITDGTLAMHGPDGSERTRFEGITAELSSPALDGPYRVRGTYGTGAAEREIRLATARPEPDGSLRFKAILRSSTAGATYTLDGRLLDLMGAPHIDGELTARLPVGGVLKTSGDGTTAGRNKPAGADDAAKPDHGEVAFELKSPFKADPGGATLSDLALSFEQDGRPQLLTGDLKAQWRDALTVDASLSSRWLDLDRIAVAGQGGTPFDSIIPLALQMRDLLPVEGRSRASFAIDQANMGRDTVSNLRLVLVRTRDKLEVEELRLGMPGGSRGEVQGVVSGPPEAPAFEGSINLHGASVVRFLGWATGNSLPFDPKGDGTFGMRSRLTIARGSAAAREIVGDLSGTALGGSVEYRWDGRPQVSLSVESPQLDARAFIPAGANLGDILDLVLHGPGAGAAAADGLGARKPGWRSAQTDASIRVNAGQLLTAARTYRDVAMEIELKGGSLRLPVLRIAGDEGFNLELEGEVSDAASRPKGTIRGVANAETAQGLAPLAELLGIPEAFRPSQDRATAMLPLRIAGSLAFGARSATSADLMLDGEVNGAGLKVNGRFDGAPAGWRAGPADVTALVEAPDAGAIAAVLTPMRPAVTRAGATAPGRVLIRASGVPADGMTSLVSLDAGDTALGFRGRVVPAATGVTATGDLELRAADATRIAALAGLSPPLRLDGLPIAGTLRLTLGEGKIALDRVALKIAGNDVKGQLSLAAAGGRRRIEGRLDADELSIPRLLSALLDQRLASVTGAAETAIAGRQGLWPDEPFDTSIFDSFDGRIQLNGKRLVLSDGLGLQQASLDITFEAGKVNVSQITGLGFGGKCIATLQIDKVLAGAEVRGSIRIVDGSLAGLTSDSSGEARATGAVSGEITFAGKGTSPRNVISVLQGGGNLDLVDAKLAALWPGSVGKAAEAALKSDPDKLAGALRAALVAALGSGRLPLPPVVTVSLGDGRLVMKPLAIETGDGRASGTANIDLKTLDLESEWRLQPNAGVRPGDKAPLPPVVVTYRGPVAQLTALEPRIASDAIERELTVRRMERDLEELERVRRLDEVRRREETERLRRQLELAPAPAPVPIAPATPQRPPAPGPG